MVRPNTMRAKTGIVFFTFGLGLLVSAFVFALPQNAIAQEAIDVAGGGVVVATVNIYDAKIVAQSGRELRISFDLYNRKGVQPQVRYAIQLQKADGGTPYVVAQKVYDETVTLREDQTISRTVNFVVPAYISGRYDVMVLAMNEQSLPFGINSAGIISFENESSALFVEIMAETCSLTIGEGKEKYSLAQGVDVDADETLTLHCSASNHFDRSVSLTPVFTRHYRSSFGQELDVVRGQTPISFSVGQKKDVVLPIPLTKEPQSYDTVVSFVDEKGNIVSNDSVVHYVIRGKSATAQSVLFDKDVYAAGEKANLQIFWSAAADAFGDSRVEGTDVGTVQMSIEILDGSGDVCAAPYEKSVTREESIVHAQIAIEKNCINPSAKISITDSEGDILTRATFTVSPDKKKAADRVKEDAGMRKGGAFVVIALITVVALGAILVTIIRRRGKGGMQGPGAGVHGILFFFLLVGALALPQSSSADTFTVGDSSCIGNRTYSVNLNKKSPYSPGETITSYGWGIDPACGNTSIVMGLRGHANGGTGYLLNCTWNGACGNRPVNSAVVLYGSATIGSAPSAAGSYQASFDGYAGFGPTWKCASARWVDDAYRLPYTVVVPVPTASLSASPNPVDYNTASILTWSSTNATSCNASGDWTGVKATSGTESTSPLTSAKTYSLTCTGTGGTSAPASVTVNVNPQPQPPTVSLTASPDQIILSSGQSLPQNTTLTWLSTNATSCIAFGGAWAGAKGTSGTESISVSSNPATFTIQCSNAAGSANDSVTVSSGCYARSCQSNSCQQAFQSASSYTCTNSCSSNADCSTGGGFREVEP